MLPIKQLTFLCLDKSMFLLYLEHKPLFCIRGHRGFCEKQSKFGGCSSNINGKHRTDLDRQYLKGGRLVERLPITDGQLFSNQGFANGLVLLFMTETESVFLAISIGGKKCIFVDKKNKTKMTTTYLRAQ